MAYFSLFANINPHRNTVSRKSPVIQNNSPRKHTTPTPPPPPTKHINRYYFPNDDDFNTALRTFNSSSQHRKTTTDNRIPSTEQRKRSYFTSVGHANVRLKMCCMCHDGGKSVGKDVYFVDTLDISQRRTVLCYGCLGRKLLENDVGKTL